MATPEAFYTDKVILVTGGCGSIGSQLVRALLKFGPRVVRVFDNNETGLYELENDLRSPKARAFIGDIRNSKRLARAFENVDLVFHTAALKHVPLCEYNPFEAVETNVIGTQNVIDAALDAQIEKAILISTDKAVNPRNVMGATKLLAERLMISANDYKGSRKTAFSCVRFGNVLNSRGSVVPLFAKQIRENNCITITNDTMTRFLMSHQQAVALIIKAAHKAQGGEIFVLKMPSFSLIDLAKVVIQEIAPLYGTDPKNIIIKRIGKRAGEKMNEELMTEDEAECATEIDGLYVIDPKHPNAKKSTGQEYTSDVSERLSSEQITALIKECSLQ
jgi:UDP-N-acetylglucosamine 4,6-dehydratase